MGMGLGLRPPVLPPCPLFGGRTEWMSRGVELEYTKWGFVFPLSPCVLLVVPRGRGKNSCSGHPNKTRTHFLKIHQLCDGPCLAAWGMWCKWICGQICVLALCFSRIRSFGLPVSDRQTQRQAQAWGGGGQEGERGELEDCKVRGAERNETQSQQRSREVESKFLTVPSKFLFLSWLLGSFISAFLCVSFPPPPQIWWIFSLGLLV